MRAEDGKIEWIKILVPLLILWGSYVTYQAYEVGSNKTAIQVTAENLRRDIDKNTAKIDKNNGVLHGRITASEGIQRGMIHELQVLLSDTWKVMLNMADNVQGQMEDMQQSPQNVDNGASK